MFCFVCLLTSWCLVAVLSCNHTLLGPLLDTTVSCVGNSVFIHANENFLSGPMTSSVRPEPNPSFGPVWCNLSGPTRVFFLLNRHFDSNKALPQLSICQFNLSTLVLVQTNPFTYIWLHISMKLIYFFYFWIFSLFIL